MRASEVSRNVRNPSSLGRACSCRAATRSSGARARIAASMANKAAICSSTSNAIGDAVA
jgi:hypothetical protein